MSRIEYPEYGPADLEMERQAKLVRVIIALRECVFALEYVAPKMGASVKHPTLVTKTRDKALELLKELGVATDEAISAVRKEAEETP